MPAGRACGEPGAAQCIAQFMAYERGRDIEVFMPYSMRLKSLSEWYVQLLAESLGKRCNREGATVHYGRTPIVAVAQQICMHRHSSIRMVV